MGASVGADVGAAVGAIVGAAVGAAVMGVHSRLVVAVGYFDSHSVLVHTVKVAHSRFEVVVAASVSYSSATWHTVSGVHSRSDDLVLGLLAYCDAVHVLIS